MTREEHADYVRWLKSLPRRKDHFRMPCPECSATRSNPKDPSFSVHITREGGWAKCFHCDFAIAWNEDEMWKREQKQQDRERQKQQKDAPQHRNTSQHHDAASQHHNTSQHHDAASQHRNTSQHHDAASQHRNTSQDHDAASQHHNTSQHHVPTLYDINGSAAFFNKTDYGMVVDRNDELGQVLVRVAKVRFDHLGGPGDAFFAFSTYNGRYTPTEERTLDHNPPEPKWEHTNFLTEKLKPEQQGLGFNEG